MNQAPTSQQESLYPIRTVSELTGVNSITLRAWERRYGIFEPVRTPSGHRMYTQEHIDLITRIVSQLERGMRIGQVKEHLAQSPASAGDADVIDIWNQYLQSMIAAIIRFDESSLEKTYGEALAVYPINLVTEKLLMPLLDELGERWEKGEGSVAEEHFFGFYLRNKLGARFHHRVISQNGPKLLLACLPGDIHETGLLLFALAASEAGYQTIMLGSNMPLEDLPETARKTGCSAIVLSGLVDPRSKTLKHGLPELSKSVDVPVYLGGRASARTHDALKRINIHSLGTDLKAGLARITAAVPLSS
ncbi:MAG: DNA-binding transcriptional MerR regulator/methylmalonyl-CoA mutase cobalamin-binding subunit [Lysobacterales bacterium]|jgi:DNA-binding transcriptional MerR regulator/methylmalonyl-CoA mutase cobalamin-binding subunit